MGKLGKLCSFPSPGRLSNVPVHCKISWFSAKMMIFFSIIHILRIVVGHARCFCPNNLTPQATTTSTTRLTVYSSLWKCLAHALAGVYMLLHCLAACSCCCLCCGRTTASGESSCNRRCCNIPLLRSGLAQSHRRRSASPCILRFTEFRKLLRLLSLCFSPLEAGS